MPSDRTLASERASLDNQQPRLWRPKRPNDRIFIEISIEIFSEISIQNETKLAINYLRYCKKAAKL